jgi:hypothetical protein
MPISFVVDYERRRVSTRAEGVITFAEIARHADSQSLGRDPTYDELFDATGALVDLTATEVRELVCLVNQASRTKPLGATAIVATQPVVFGLARMYSTLCESVGARVGVFRTVGEAEKWLESRSSRPRVI